jgi:hypothetical protein
MSPPAQQEPELQLTVDGEHVVIRFGDLTPRDARDFRRAVGTPLMQAFTPENLDLDMLAGLVWLARRRDNPALTYEEVESTTTFGSFVFDTETSTNGQEAPDDPEA